MSPKSTFTLDVRNNTLASPPNLMLPIFTDNSVLSTDTSLAPENCMAPPLTNTELAEKDTFDTPVTIKSPLDTCKDDCNQVSVEVPSNRTNPPDTENVESVTVAVNPEKSAFPSMTSIMAELVSERVDET